MLYSICYVDVFYYISCVDYRCYVDVFYYIWYAVLQMVFCITYVMLYYRWSAVILYYRWYVYYICDVVFQWYVVFRCYVVLLMLCCITTAMLYYMLVILHM